MLARVLAATPWGIDALPVEIEVHLQRGLPALQLVGLPDAAVKESRDRVRSAIINSGHEFRPRSTVINLAPADLRKEGNHLDLGIALGLLAAHGTLPSEALEGRMCCGELGLDGRLRRVRGALAIAALARELGLRELLLPAGCAPQAAALRRVPVIPLHSLSEALAHLVGVRKIAPYEAGDRSHRAPEGRPCPVNLHDISGQEPAKRALEIAAAGDHNLLFTGPPGSGKTLLAQALPGLLPPLQEEEALVVTKIHSVSGQNDQRQPILLRDRPFRAPHHSISTAGLIGGGTVPRPGEVSMAHGGVLFLDELPEFRRDALETLRQPLESGVVDLVRARCRFRFPARFRLLAAMNPCRCGYHGDPRRDCRCPPGDVERYRARISGPLLDRIDLQVVVPAVPIGELRDRSGESSGAVRSRILEARKWGRQRRSELEPGSGTAGALLHRRDLEAGARRAVIRAYDRMKLSARATTRILRVARTIADLSLQPTISVEHVSEALQYRTE